MTDGEPPNLGEYIRRQRQLHEMSMRQVAELAGISNPYLSQIERGLREPSERVIEAIAKTLELSADALNEQAGRAPKGDEAASEVEAAIGRDPKLSARQRSALIEVYRSFAGLRPRPRSG